jgi:hypothetical protein
MSLKRKLLNTLKSSNNNLYWHIIHIIHEGHESSNKNDTIIRKIIVESLLLYFTFEQNTTNSKNLMLKSKNDIPQNINNFIELNDDKNETYYLNIDLDIIKLYISKEFLNHNKQITRDIVEIELTNIGKGFLSGNFEELHACLSPFNQSVFKNEKSEIKIEIPNEIIKLQKQLNKIQREEKSKNTNQSNDMRLKENVHNSLLEIKQEPDNEFENPKKRIKLSDSKQIDNQSHNPRYNNKLYSAVIQQTFNSK